MTEPRRAIVRGAAPAHQLAQYLRSHRGREDALVSEYRGLCRDLPSPGLRYLARLILSDEERHQMIFGDLAETVFASDDLKASGMPILDVTRIGDADVRRRTLEALRHAIEQEEDEHADLSALITTLAPWKQSDLWSVLIEFIADDTKRHLHLLEFMSTRML